MARDCGQRLGASPAIVAKLAHSHGTVRLYRAGEDREWWWERVSNIMWRLTEDVNPNPISKLKCSTRSSLTAPKPSSASAQMHFVSLFSSSCLAPSLLHSHCFEACTHNKICETCSAMSNRVLSTPMLLKRWSWEWMGRVR